ncbi:MAG: DEAD/DEAH box helicase [Actinobacteria bacterium]|nr:DEAD/DEAH box helicase [Actinomycetota bacterium]
MYVLHAHWQPSSKATESGAILFWAETYPESKPGKHSSRDHPSCAGADALRTLLGRAEARTETFLLRLPGNTRRPLPSLQGHAEPDGRRRRKPTLRAWNIPGVGLAPVEAVSVLTEWLEADRVPSDVRLGDSLRYWQRAAQLALESLARQRLIPGLKRLDGDLYTRWLPLLDGARLDRLAEAMPPVCRAAPEEAPGPGTLLKSFLEETCDALVRAWTFAPEAMRDPADPGSRWVRALFGSPAPIEVSAAQQASLERSHQLWLRSLKLAGDEHFRVALQLSAPDNQTEGRDWALSFALQARDDPSLLVRAADVWHSREALGEVRRLKEPQEKLLTGLGYAARFFKPIDRALKSTAPEGLQLSATEAFHFLRDCAPLLEESGFGVLVPPWWHRSGARLGLRARLSPASDGVSQGIMSLDSLVKYRWDLALGGHSLSKEEFETLVALKSPLVQLRGEWVRLDPEQVDAALKFFARQDHESEIGLPEALQVGLGGVEEIEGLQVEDVDFDGWLRTWFDQLSGDRKLEPLPIPEGLHAQLRPYQRVGYSWLDFLRNAGLGACLADDMGLGKTIQTLALLRHDQEQGQLRGPVLLVCPTSVVSNWQKEAERFTPGLRVLMHQGPDRLRGEAFAEELQQTDLVVTSYALLRRDAEMLQGVEWYGVVLDEAQNIKNPEAKQSRLVYGLRAGFRLALTGTPVENHLGELWSIMRFLNPGYLGSRKDFSRRFARPIESEQDEEALGRLHKLTSPLVLRRLKSDPKVIQDLPEKQETKEYCQLGEEQASLYEAVVQDAMLDLQDSEGIKRKGLVLSMLTKLKQICNHPAQFLHEGSGANGEARRSEKMLRLLELLEEILSVGDRALIFTQYREMGDLLETILSERFGASVQFIHGGTSAKRRSEMVRRFQEDDSGPALFILSLKAGGTGLNLTRANHVFHFDRWWNPAVEDQATDRAFRIGQKRNVQVHKFVCVGTLEEKIDAMIEQKKALAESVVGAGESWLTEFSNQELRDLVKLRREALA